MNRRKSSPDKFELGVVHWSVRVEVVNDKYLLNISKLTSSISRPPTWAFMEYHRRDGTLWYDGREGLWPVPITDDILVHLSPRKTVTIPQLVNLIEERILHFHERERP